MVMGRDYSTEHKACVSCSFCLLQHKTSLSAYIQPTGPLQSHAPFYFKFLLYPNTPISGDLQPNWRLSCCIEYVVDRKSWCKLFPSFSCRQMPTLLSVGHYKLKQNTRFFSGYQAISSHTLFLCPSSFVWNDKRTKMHIQVVSVVQFPAVVFHFIVF